MGNSEGSCCSPQRQEFDSSTTPLARYAEANLSQTNFVTIPAGEFWMGSNKVHYPADGEGPSRLVWLDEFKISKFATTNSEFAAFIDATGYKTQAEIYGWSYVFNGLTNEQSPLIQDTRIASSAPWWSAINGAYWYKPFGDSRTIEHFLDHPVVHVTLNDAFEYCKWSGYKLPTEAQWEKASRGGLVDKLFPWGDELLKDGNHHTNIWQGEFPTLNTVEDGFLGTAPVNSFAANNFGLYNTIGNVWEWTKDFWSIRWHLSEKEETRRNPIGPIKTQGNRVLKGGSFMCHESYCYRYRNSARTYNSPQSSTSHIGFRCIL